MLRVPAAALKVGMNQSRVRDLLDYDRHTGGLLWRVSRGSVRAGQRAGTVKRDGYRRVMIDGREWPEAHVVWLWVHGTLPPLQVDHINLNKADNRIDNLRLATCSQQQANTRPSKRNKHGCKGLKWRADRRKWRVDIYVNGCAKTVGHYTHKPDAIAAYALAARKHFGDFARVL